MLRQRGGSRRSTFVPLTPVNTCCSFNSFRRSSFIGSSNSRPIIRPRPRTSLICGNFFQLRHQILTYLGCIFNQILLTYYVQDSKRCAACQMITAESSAQLSVNRSEHRTDKYTGHKARTREYGGSGIGLSIVKAIMDSLRQQCGVINHEDGVEFWMELESNN